MSETKIKTGISGLDERLGGGLPSGSTILLLSNSETCLRMFSQQTPFNMASSGRKIFYVTILKEPQYIREEMSLYGWKTSDFEQNGRWEFIDAYTQKLNALLMRKEKEPRFDLLVLIRSMTLSKLNESEVMVIDSLSDLLMTHPTLAVIELLDIVSSQIRKNRGLAFLPVLKEMHDERTIATISHLADAVVMFEIGEAHFEGRILFWKMRRSRLEPLFLPFSVTEKGIVAETFTRVI